MGLAALRSPSCTWGRLLSAGRRREIHDDGRLEQVFQTDQGTRWNVYRITGDGQMQMDATTQGMMMPQPLHFVFDYARQP